MRGIVRSWQITGALRHLEAELFPERAVREWSVFRTVHLDEVDYNYAGVLVN